MYNIVPKTRKSIEYISKNYRKGFQDIRFLPKGFDTSNKMGFLVNDKQLMFTSFDAITATVIEDPNIVACQKQMWEILWHQIEVWNK